MQSEHRIRSLAWATDIDVLPHDRVVSRHRDHLCIRSPSNPGHWWGNFLLFDAPPASGDGARWEAAFAECLGSLPGVRHVAFAWDAVDGSIGAAASELVPRGFELERTVTLVARPDELISHPRRNREVLVRALDPLPGAETSLWEQVVELQVAARDPALGAVEDYRRFARARLADLRALFRAGRGSWFVALEGDQRGGTTAKVVASLGIVVTGRRARYQAVDTAETHRRRGICSRLVVEAAQRSAQSHPIEHLVICADPGYHATQIYESLGFRRAESVTGALRRSSV